MMGYGFTALLGFAIGACLIAALAADTATRDKASAVRRDFLLATVGLFVVWVSAEYLGGC